MLAGLKQKHWHINPRGSVVRAGVREPGPAKCNTAGENVLVTPFSLAGYHTLGNKSQGNNTNGEKQFTLIWNVEKLEKFQAGH